MQPQHTSSTPRRARHIPRSLPRRLVGWCMIGLAGLGFVLPVLPGIVFLAFGILLLGPRDPLLRRLSLIMRLVLRRWCRVRQPQLRQSGRWARQHYVETRRLLRQYVYHRPTGGPRWYIHGLLLIGTIMSLTMMAGGSLLIWRMVP